jgi:hypothetical protein
MLVLTKMTHYEIHVMLSWLTLQSWQGLLINCITNLSPGVAKKAESCEDIDEVVSLLMQGTCDDTNSGLVKSLDTTDSHPASQICCAWEYS